MATITVQEIERNPAGFVQRLESGESLVVLRDDRPLAEIKPLPTPLQNARPFALCRGEFQVPDDFDAPLPEEILKEFEGR